MIDMYIRIYAHEYVYTDINMHKYVHIQESSMYADMIEAINGYDYSTD
jgi:hypothetical protein